MTALPPSMQLCEDKQEKIMHMLKEDQELIRNVTRESAMKEVVPIASE